MLIIIIKSPKLNSEVKIIDELLSSNSKSMDIYLENPEKLTHGIYILMETVL